MVGHGPSVAGKRLVLLFHCQGEGPTVSSDHGTGAPFPLRHGAEGKALAALVLKGQQQLWQCPPVHRVEGTSLAVSPVCGAERTPTAVSMVLKV